MEECTFRLAIRFAISPIELPFVSPFADINYDSTLVFHVLHCANQCAAPKLWSKLK